jgi:hypothetical protein
MTKRNQHAPRPARRAPAMALERLQETAGRGRPKRPRGRSYRTDTKGRESFGDWLKRNAIGIVQIETDDLEIPVGWLLGETKTYYKVGTCSGSDRRGRLHWQALRIRKDRVVRFRQEMR